MSGCRVHLGHWKPCVWRGESGQCIRELRPRPPNPFPVALTPSTAPVELFSHRNPLFVKALFPKSDLLSQDTAANDVHGDSGGCDARPRPGCWPGSTLCLGHCSLEWSQAGKHMPSPESQGWRSLCRGLPQLPSPGMERGQLAHRLLS